jgi:hypothetical protein
MIDPSSQLKTRHQFIDYLYWNLVASVPVITACIAIASISILWFIVYLVLSIALIILIYRFYCTHCLHYIADTEMTKCMFFWGIPKYFTPRPGPLNLSDKVVSIIALLILVGFPLYWLFLRIDLLVIYVLSLGVLGATIRRYECMRCIYFECPANCVPADIRDQVTPR